MQSKILYPGTFDPITWGHIDLVERALKIFDHVIIAVAKSARKEPVLSKEARVNLAREVFSGQDNVEIIDFEGLLVHLAQSLGVRAILRGLRAISDFETEFQLAAMNRQLEHNIETLFLMPAVEYQCISSSIVREVASMGGDLEKFVPPQVASYLYTEGVN